MHQASTKPFKPSLNASASPLTSSVSSKLHVVTDHLSSKCSSVLPASSSNGSSTQVWIKRQSTLNHHDKSSLFPCSALKLQDMNGNGIFAIDDDAHDEPCATRSVKREGPNRGRLFYVCARAQGKDKTPEERRIVICIFDDVVEQCREAALRYYDTYLPFLLEACNDDNADVRQMRSDPSSFISYVHELLLSIQHICI
ncbi:hypothetical protein ZIOFF_047939 [Zingiber officinale]|uniref:GRF-type domain-containing protein n=1 Tax=Zingiber officinale TaxID=94328 RepID=A0A8J5FQD6_ZINOF|nr:hypothetical protein ZIOFF_047939 [Zingiber officinale]